MSALALAIAVAAPSPGEPCRCAQPAAGVDNRPACCREATPSKPACCSGAESAECCDPLAGSCDCEGCHGPRPADPLGPAPGDVVAAGFTALPPVPPATLSDADALVQLAASSDALRAAPPPDLHSLLCVWTL